MELDDGFILPPSTETVMMRVIRERHEKKEAPMQKSNKLRPILDVATPASALKGRYFYVIRHPDGTTNLVLRRSLKEIDELAGMLSPACKVVKFGRYV